MPAINVVFIEKGKRDRTWSDILTPRPDICGSARVVGDRSPGDSGRRSAVVGEGIVRGS
jgi:hypothetical protein